MKEIAMALLGLAVAFLSGCRGPQPMDDCHQQARDFQKILSTRCPIPYSCNQVWLCPGDEIKVGGIFKQHEVETKVE